MDPLVERNLERLAVPEDWVELQGGKPEVWLHGTTGALIAHVYDKSFSDPDNPLHHGLLVPTIYDRLTDSILHPHVFQTSRGLVNVPASLLARFHGLECELTSRQADGRNIDSYERIRSATAYETKRQTWIGRGFRPYRLGVSAVGEYQLHPVKVGN